MYNLEKLEKYAEKIFDRLNYFSDYTLETIARRIKAAGELSAYDSQALKNIADITGNMDAVTKKLAEITRLNIKDIENVYTQVITDGVNTYKPLYDFKNMQFVPFEQNEFARQLAIHWAKQTAGEMINLSRTKALCFDKYDLFGNVVGSTPLEGAFQSAIDEAVAAVSAGTVDFNTAMSRTVERLGGSGIKVTYGSGVNRTLSSMVRQNLLYGAKQSARSYDEYIGEKLGCDGFEVDAHSGCRPSHIFMQGKMYSYDGRKVIDGVVYEDGAEALDRLNDYNCLHFKTAVILGVSEPRYSKEELDRIHRETTELIEYDGRKKTLYEWKQTQRRLERGVRNEQQKANTFEAAGMHGKAQDCRARVKAYRNKYDDMCKNVKGIEPRLDRMRVYKGVDNGGRSGIIKVQGGKSMRINNIDSPIEQRNTAKGNPNAILQAGRPLNNRQQKLLSILTDYDSWVTVNKKSVNMKDLSALTAHTGDEFALFTKGKERLIIRGNKNSVNIDVDKAVILSDQGYKWSGHTHPGIEKISLMPSGGDKEILKCFKQEMSTIYNSKGVYRTFEKE